MFRPLPRPRSRHRRLRGVTVATAAVATAVLVTGVATAAAIRQHDKVGDATNNGVVLPSNQTVSPLGQRIQINNGRLLSSTLSPDSKFLAASSWRDFTGFLTVFNMTTGTVAQQIGTGTTGDPSIGDGTVAADGPIYSPDGGTLYLPQTADLLKFAVSSTGVVATTPTVIPMAAADGTAYLPSGGTFNASGSLLYLALNNANTLGVLNTATDKLVRQIPVGVAPRQVALVNGSLYVSNEGGRRATKQDVTNLTSGTPVVSNASTGAVNNGTVSVVDPSTAKVSTIKVGLQPTALYAAGSTLFVANSNDDSVSVIDTASNTVAQTFNTNPVPGSSVGSYPNAITMPDSTHVLVSIGRDNALAVYQFIDAKHPVKYEGLIPTDWYPVNVQVDHQTNKLVVTNDKGIGARGLPQTVSEGPDANTVSGPNTYSDTGTLTTFAEPTDQALGKLTHTVFVDNNWLNLPATTPISKQQAAKITPVAIPTRLGAPSKIKHVFLIVKENRTYDQVLGDIGKGDSDPSLTQFGASVTPNEHALANQFGLFDNFYDEGTLSADGHNWLMQADANDYIEKEFGAFYRSYPAQGGDALAYQRDGFLWNAAQAAGNTVRNFGEYNNFFTADNDPNRPTWSQWYQDSLILEGKASGTLPVPINKYRTYADIPSLNKITDPTYPRFDTDVPDQYRTDIWLKSFRQSEQTGNLANLNMLWVPDDHTAGTSGASPYPTAAVADNDLAVGRIVDEISHSRFWDSSAIFVLEDDSQAGTDHVDGHRSPLFIASPYAKHKIVDDTYYSQLNVVKTIEQILGVAPMNQEDRAAVPMYDAFTDTANPTPFVVRPNQIPLTYGLSQPSGSSRTDTPARPSITGEANPTPAARTVQTPALSTDPAIAAIQKQWQVWSSHQQFGGRHPDEDQSNPAQLNHIDWYASTGWARPYPGDKRILGPYQVPGWDTPPLDLH